MARTPISELRERMKGKTQTQLAQELGIPQPVLSQVLAGTRAIPRKVVKALGYERTVVYRRKAEAQAPEVG